MAEVKNEAPAAQPLSIVVKDQAGNEVQFKVKASTKFEKIIGAYCTKKAMDPASVRFLFDGQRIRPEQTPADVGMEDEDCIDVVMEQVGGCQ